MPVMVPGWAVLEEILRDFALEDPHEEFAVTLTVPETKVVGKVTEMEEVPKPLLITAPVGTVQV